MGKNRHSKDRLFITQTEHKYLYGGKKQEVRRAYKRTRVVSARVIRRVTPRNSPPRCRRAGLPFDCCAITLRPFSVRPPPPPRDALSLTIRP